MLFVPHGRLCLAHRFNEDAFDVHVIDSRNAGI